MFWRYHSGWNYNGVIWNNCFKVRFNNVGYTAAGENIDSIVAFDRVMVWKWNETPAPTWFAPFEVTKDYGPLVGATTYSQNTGVDLQFTSLFVKNGTDTLIDANSEIDIMYWDIDQPVVNPDGSFDYHCHEQVAYAIQLSISVNFQTTYETGNSHPKNSVEYLSCPQGHA